MKLKNLINDFSLLEIAGNFSQKTENATSEIPYFKIFRPRGNVPLIISRGSRLRPSSMVD